LIEDSRHEDEMIERLIRKRASNGEPIHILEAGCGRKWPFNLALPDFVWVA
jgi:hypothetical protein